MALIDKIKSDIQFRNKVIGGAVVFALVMVGGVVSVLAMNSKQDNSTELEDKGAIAEVPSDTTRTVETKRTIYSQMQAFEEDEKKDLKVVADENIVGKNKEEIAEMEKKEDDEIAEYMRQRREKQKELEKSSSRTDRYSSEPSYQSSGYAPQGSRRKYNPYASKEDWTDETDIELAGYKTGREKMAEKQEEQKVVAEQKRKKRNEVKTFDDLSPTEQRRILLETGQSQYEETVEFSAMIMSSGMVKSGETITIITKEDAYLNFEKIPKGTTMAGIVSFGDNRLQVSFSTIRLKKKIVKVNLSLYGLDGLEGLPVGSDLLSKDVSDTRIEEATDIDVTGTKAERIGKRLFKSAKSRKEVKVDLGRDIMCILVNNNAK